ARPFGRRRPASRAELDPPLREVVHRGDALGDASRVIHGGGDVGDGGADVDALRPGGHPGEVHLGCRLMGVVLKEVVLRRPVVLESDGGAELRYLELPQVARMLVVPWRAVHLREDPEFHQLLLRLDVEPSLATANYHSEI